MSLPLKGFFFGFLLCIAFGQQVLAKTSHTLDSLDSQRTESIRLLSALIKIQSTSGREGAVGRYIAAYCKQAGLQVQMFSEADSSYNFAASLFPLSAGKPNVVLLNHLDVVAAADTLAWTVPPFSGLVTDSCVWGRGALDMKGMAVMQLMALKAQLESNPSTLPYNVTMLCVSGEETGGTTGAEIVTKKYLDILKPIVVYGEGGSGLTGAVPGKPNLTMYTVSVAEKSNMWLQLQLKFRGHGHGAAAPINYPNRDMIKALNKLADVESNIKFIKTTKRMFKQFGKIIGGFNGFVLSHADWWIFRPALRKLLRTEPNLKSLLTNTATLTHLSNPPGPVNQIAQEATALLDCRLLPGTNRKKFLRDVKYGLFEPRFKITILNENPESEESSVTAAGYLALKEACEAVDQGAAVIPILFPGSTDNNYFRAKGINVYGLTPIHTSRALLETIHGADERIPLTELARGIHFYKALIESLMKKDLKQ
jgi:carboxypeptidase PM20D1